MPIDLVEYDFVDFGCSAGGSMKFAMEHLGGKRGIGIDLDEKKVAATRREGFDATVGDLSKPLSFQNKVRFSTLVHVLEHVPSPAIAEQILFTAASISEEFILVRQPWFDSDGPLAAAGFKLFWSDWSGHTNHMTTLEMYCALRDIHKKGLIKHFTIWGHQKISSTAEGCVVPLSTPPDSHHYQPGKDAPKAIKPITVPCFYELVAYISVNGQTDVSSLPQPFGDAELILSETGNKPPATEIGEKIA